jgi:hypothetical protein
MGSGCSELGGLTGNATGLTGNATSPLGDGERETLANVCQLMMMSMQSKQASSITLCMHARLCMHAAVGA